MSLKRSPDFFNSMRSPNTSSEKSVRQLAESAVVDLAADKDVVFGRLNSVYLRSVTGAFVLSVVAFPILVSAILPNSIWLGGVIIAICIGLVVHFGYLQPVVVEKIWNKRLERLLLKEYSRSWRARLLRYVQSCHAPTKVVIGQFLQAGTNLNYQQITNLVHNLATHDPAIYLLSISQQFVR
jgi:hypothetical protein